MKPESPRKSSLWKSTKGAVLAEFIVVFMPLMTTFMTFVQYARMSTANLVLRHAVVSGARAAAVVSNKNNTNPGNNGAEDDIQRAVKLALGPWYYRGNIDIGSVDVKDDSSAQDPYGMVSVTVNASYRCDVPLGSVVACGFGRRKTFKALRASFPHQGARYQVDK